MIITTTSFVGCKFTNNSRGLLFIENKAPALGKAIILLKSLNISHNYLNLQANNQIILLVNMDVHISGTFHVTDNRNKFSIVHFLSCDILLSGKILFNNNYCAHWIHT